MRSFWGVEGFLRAYRGFYGFKIVFEGLSLG